MVTSESISDSPGRAEDSAEPREDSPPKANRRWYQIPFAAAVGAWVVMLLSLTPSLLPRSGIVQGLVTGVAIAIGYGLGVLVGWFVRQFTERYP
ncbi:MAG: putative membrane protein, partial [Actinomycetes bacterium]